MKQSLHAVLVVIQKTGVLIVGKSGSGKSSLALELLRRGYQLVSDDAVLCQIKQHKIYGSNPLKLGQYLDVPVIGIIDVSKIYGQQAHCPEHSIDLIIKLGKNAPALPKAFQDYSLKQLQLHTKATSDLATLLECAAAEQQLQQQGYNAKQTFFEQQQQAIAQIQTKESTA